MSDVVTKNPEDRLDYDIDYSKWLPRGDYIINATATIEGSAQIDGVYNTASTVKVWVIGGADGETCRVSTVVSTSEGRTKEFCFRMRIRDNC